MKKLTRSKAPPPDQSAGQVVALYCRVSTEDQAEAGTIETQLQYLRTMAAGRRQIVQGEYRDEGVPGTVPFAERPEGARLLEDARAGRFTTVLVYRLDRLARRMPVLLDANDQLDEAGVSWRSEQEAFDTSNMIGKLLFHILGSIAEWEHDTITERTRMGRDRVAREGKWLGTIPYGYEVDSTHRLVPSARRIAVLDCTEAELLADLYERIAAGSSAMAECRRLNALGVPPPQPRYPSGASRPARAGWAQGGLALVLHNPVYYGEHTLKSEAGPIVRAVPSLVSRELWERTQAALLSNRRLSKKNSKRDYLLRGLVVCGGCGRHYTGATVVKPQGERPYYRCSAEPQALAGVPGVRHPAKRVRTEWLDALVWSECHNFAEHPDQALDELGAQLAARRSHTDQDEAELLALRAREREYAAERMRVRQMRRRNQTDAAEIEAILDEIDAEAQTTAARIRVLERQAEALADEEARHADVRETLRALRAQLQAAEATADYAARRAVVEHLIEQVIVRTEGDGREMTATVEVRYRLGPPRVVDAGSRTPSENYCLTLDRCYTVLSSGTVAA